MRDDAGDLVCTREYFPATLTAAVRQKARWMTGIALAGWDRLGWQGSLAERWMRFRDRRGPLAAVILCCAYAAILLFGVTEIARLVTGTKEIGRASCRERVCQYVSISVVDVSLKKNIIRDKKHN